MNTPFLISSSSFLQVTRTCIKAWMSLNFGKIPTWNTELAALERLKKSMYNVVNSSLIFDRIFFIFAGIKDNH